MSIPNIQNLKWMSDIELLDTDLEPPECISPPHLDAFFKKLADTSSCANISNEIIRELAKDLKNVVPWFLEQMPPLYLWTTSQETIVNDILEIISGKVLSEKQVAERYNSSDQTCALIASGKDASSTFRLVSRLSQYKAKTVRIFNTFDKKMGICEVYEAPYAKIGSSLLKISQLRFDALQKHLPQDNPEIYESFISNLDADYLQTATVKQMLLDYTAIQYCVENENAYLKVSNFYDKSAKDTRVRIDFAIKNIPVTAAIENSVGLFNRYGYQVRRVIGNEIRIGANQSVTVLHLVVANFDGTDVTSNEKLWGKLCKSLKALFYVDHDDEFAKLLQGANPLSLNETNLIRATANWTHIFLTKQNPYYYSLDRVSKIILNHRFYVENCIAYFRALFSPRLTENRKENSLDIHEKLHSYINEIIDSVERNILREGVMFLKNILKTNYFLVSKGGLTFRMNPEVLNKEFYPETPFGFFYIIGRNFRAFQVRYRDISRGGMRVVLPRNSGDYENALAGLFDETNGLASAQQLKNKDIPEGGSKSVLVVKPGGDKSAAVKAAVSGLLDLINVDPKTQVLAPEIIDYYGKEEIIYLGPDENLTNDLIKWIIKHALYRKYKYAYAFMSSKPEFGINHKTYGVTSEGVNVYVDNVLNYLGLKDKTFRVKMTGGPDGDVAGNEMHILHREYGEKCRLVAVADGYGAAYDPNGLEWSEILRLFYESKPILDFDSTKLSCEDAFVIPASTRENIKIRDSLYATAEADIFIPGGGRPYTVRESNWSKYLLPNGKPSSLAIVEGANIFFTKEARQNLVKSGVIVIKDSSANKAGVGCSSYEIIACLTLSPDEFADIKDIYVQQVLDIIRANADKEAKLLFREWKKNKSETNLVQLSYKVSTAINSAKDLLREQLMLLSDDEFTSKEYTYVIMRHCPQILVDKYFDRILQKLPRAHKIAILCAYMASHLIYKEGLNWLERIPSEKMLTVVSKYMLAEKNLDKMIREIEKSNTAYKEEITSILKHSGAKFLAMR